MVIYDWELDNGHVGDCCTLTVVITMSSRWNLSTATTVTCSKVWSKKGEGSTLCSVTRQRHTLVESDQSKNRKSTLCKEGTVGCVDNPTFMITFTGTILGRILFVFGCPLATNGFHLCSKKTSKRFSC
jgi:hypothetical protein